MAYDESLREAASHRGLKLLKSRRRKPGVGDYGHFGLADASGKPLFGVGDSGLTATAQEIADYLRKGEASTWAESAKVIPARAKKTPAKRPRKDETDTPSAIRPRPARRSDTNSSRPDKIARRDRSQVAKREAESEVSATAPPVATPEPVPPPLSIRDSRPNDAKSLAALIGTLGIDGTERNIRRAISAAAKRDEPILVADREGVIGCLAWHVIPLSLSGAVARISLIAVSERDRREGIGRALYEAAATLFRKRKVEQVEIMSDIAVRNVNGFYRAIGLEQTSYRFAGRL